VAKRPTGLRIDDAAWPLLQAFVSYWGITDADGAAGGGTLVCSDLTNQPDFDGNQVVIISGDYAGQARDISGTTTGGTVTAASAFGGQIVTGTIFAILALRTVPAEVAALAADVGDASSSTLGSLYGILGNPEAALGDSMAHVPKYTGNILYVDGVNGDDANSGQEPNVAKKTIGAAITAASAGDRIVVRAATYDEAIDLNKNSLELICEQGTILSNSTPGTVLIVSADYCRVEGPILAQAGQIGLQVTGNFNDIKDCLAFGCSVGFDIGGAENHTDNCRSIQHTTTGFDVTGSYGLHRRLVAAGAGAVRGIYLSANTADRNHFHDCHTMGNTTAGWEVVAGADNNLFSMCSTATDDGAKVDNGTNNTWDDFSEGSQISPGQSRDQDLKDIYDQVSTTSPGKLQLAATTIDLQQAAGSYDLFTGTTQDVVIEKLVVRLPNVDVSDDANITSISVQTDDTTPQVFISSTTGAKANLTAEAQLSWTGAVLIKVGTKIQLTIAGGAADAPTVCDVVCECRAVVAGGHLA